MNSFIVFAEQAGDKIRLTGPAAADEPLKRGARHFPKLFAASVLPYTYSSVTLIHDTHPDAAAAQQEMFRRMTPQQRVEICFQLSDDVRSLALDGLRSRRPDLDAKGLRRELRRIMYGSEREP